MEILYYLYISYNVGNIFAILNSLIHYDVIHLVKYSRNELINF